MPSLLPEVHLLTCDQRRDMCQETLSRWARTDWPGRPEVHFDRAAEDAARPWGDPARASRLTNAFAAMLRAVLAEPGREREWLLLLEDDVDFHPRLATHVRSWAALDELHCSLASLYNPSLRSIVVPHPPAHAFAAEPKSFIDAQAILLRRGAARRVLAEWPALSGLTGQRLASWFGAQGPIWVHQPSLVQHVAKDSSWGARIQHALDFDPAWEPRK